MKLKYKEMLLILIMIVVFVIAGFLRDAVFTNINAQLFKLYFKNYEFTLPPYLSVFETWPYMKLYYFKYVITAVFIIIYFMLSMLAVRIFSGSMDAVKWVYYAYGIVLLLCLLTYFGGIFLHNFPKGYLFTRNLVGLLQSPFIVMMIIPALKLEKKS
jgi:hypothetical protein